MEKGFLLNITPREAVPSTPKVHRMKAKSVMKQRKNTPVAKVKKSLSSKSFTEEVLKEVKVNNTAKKRPRTTTTVPKNASTPKLKEKKIVPLSGSVRKTAKKEHWKKRPKPAHSGVPMSEVMMEELTKKFQKPDFS